MPINLIPNPSSTPTSASQWTALVAREDTAAIGGGINLRVFTLTNEATTARPEVAIGSIIEVGGSWYQADADTALTDDAGLVDGTVHIKLVPTGATVVPYLTADAIPVWDSEKGGWYDGDDKFLPFEMTQSGAVTKVYTNKCEWINQSKSVKICNDGSIGLDGSLTVGGSGTFGSGLSVDGNLGISGALSGVTTLGMNGALSGVTTLGASGTGTFGSVSSGSVSTGSGAIKWKTYSATLLAGNTSVDVTHGLAVSNILGVIAFKNVQNVQNAVPNFPNTPKDISASSTVFRLDFSNDSAPIGNYPVRVIAFYI